MRGSRRILSRVCRSKIIACRIVMMIIGPFFIIHLYILNIIDLYIYYVKNYKIYHSFGLFKFFIKNSFTFFINYIV